MNKYEFVISAKDKTSQAFASINKGLSGVSSKSRDATIAVGATTAAFAALMIKTTQNAKEIDTLSKLAGESAEQFQASAFAFEQFNISQEKYADISKDVQDKLGDFLATGAGPFADFFENVAPKVGLTADALRDLSSTDVLIAVKNAMDEANVSAKEQVFYMEAIANDATALLPAIKDNGQAIKDYASEFNSLNAAMSQSDLDTMKEVATDFSRIQAALTGVSNKLSLEFAPYLQAATDLIIEATKESDNFSQEIKNGFEVAEDVIMTTAFAMGKVTDFIADAYNGFQELPPWMQEAGLIGAFIGGKKGLVIAAAAGKAIDGWMTTAEWFQAYQDGNVSFGEWLTANNEEATARLEQLKDGVEEVKREVEGVPPIDFGGGSDGGWFEEYKKKVAEYKRERKELSEESTDDAGLKIDTTRAEQDVKRFMSMVDMLDEINGIEIDLSTNLNSSAPDFNKDDWLPEDLELDLPVSGRFQFDDSFKESASDFWSDFDDEGMLDLEPTVDFREATAANQALIDNTISTFEQIHEEKLRFAEMDEELEQMRYERQLEQMEREVELLEEKGLLTQEIKARYREAEVEAEENHQSRLQEIEDERAAEMAGTYQALLGVMGSYYEGMEGKKAAYARAAISLASIMLDKEKQESIQEIGANMYSAAMKAFDALAAIPFVGPVLGGIAAAGVLTLGAGYMAKVSGLASFDGGGYTGDGVRSGGVDGKGGYHAILHPQEYVVDLTKTKALNNSRQSALPEQKSAPNYQVQMGNTIIYGDPSERTKQYLDMRDKSQMRQLKRLMEKPI